MGFFDFLTGEQPPLIRQAVGGVRVMLNSGRDMFAAGAAHLLDNEILDVDLPALDAIINEQEQALRRSVLEHLTIDPKHELALSLKLISIVQEAERIGDLAKTLSETARLAHKPRLGPPVEPLRHARSHILRMFDQTRYGFIEGDTSAARQLMDDQRQTKADLIAYLQRLADNRDLTPNEGIVYALGARALSRVSSHLANIASTVACPFDQIRRGSVLDV